MLAESRRDPHLECCGLLAGSDAVISTMLSARNIHVTPATAFEIAPNDLFRLFREIREQRLEMLGIYHSHPTSDNSPSPTDIERAFYPDVAYFILSPLSDAKNPVRAFHIRNAYAEELQVETID
jgi:proteasome lid subunit RPN8/RPN11